METELKRQGRRGKGLAVRLLVAVGLIVGTTVGAPSAANAAGYICWTAPFNGTSYPVCSNGYASINTNFKGVYNSYNYNIRFYVRTNTGTWTYCQQSKTTRWHDSSSKEVGMSIAALNNDIPFGPEPC